MTKKELNAEIRHSKKMAKWWLGQAGYKIYMKNIENIKVDCAADWWRGSKVSYSVTTKDTTYSFDIVPCDRFPGAKKIDNLKVIDK